MTVDNAKQRERQLAKVRELIREWREDAAECQRRSAECQRRADEHAAESADANATADRWEAVHRAIQGGLIPGLDTPPAVKPDVEVPF